MMWHRGNQNGNLMFLRLREKNETTKKINQIFWNTESKMPGAQHPPLSLPHRYAWLHALCVQADAISWCCQENSSVFCIDIIVWDYGQKGSGPHLEL